MKKIKAFIRFFANPRLLLCVGMAWMITNGWAYVMLGIGAYYGIEWMVMVGGAYLAFLWFPFTPEKIVTALLSLLFMHWIFPKDEKTLGILKLKFEKIKNKLNRKKSKKEKQDQEPTE